MNLLDFFGNIFVILLIAYTIVSTWVILAFFPEVPRWAKWWLKTNTRRLIRWLTYSKRAQLRHWWQKQGWRVIHMFWLALGTVAFWLSAWAIHIIFFLPAHER